MDPLTIGLVTGGASLLGSLFSSNQSAQNTQAQIAASQQQQATQNAFSERMSDTAYTRATADMKNAGLNPAMMFGSGSAASSPTGSSIQAPMPQTKSPLGDLGSNVKSGLDAAVTATTQQKLVEEMANLQATRKLTAAEAGLKVTQKQLADLDIPGAAVKAQSARDILSMDPDVRKGIVQGKFQEEHVGGAVGGIVGAVKASAKAASDWYNGISIRPKGGGDFSDRFNSVYGNDR